MSVGFRIVPVASRPSDELVAEVRRTATSHLSDCMNRLSGATAGLRPMHRGGVLCGPAFTVRSAAGDNLMVHKALDLAQPGDVIVVDAGGDMTQAIIGEIMSRLAARRRLGGMVIDGAVRDSAAIAAGDFPIYARGVTHRGPYKNGPGEIGSTVQVGGMVVHPGDIVLGDADGLLALRPDEAPSLLAAARALAAREEAIMREIDAGTVDRKWVDAALRAHGVVV